MCTARCRHRRFCCCDSFQLHSFRLLSPKTPTLMGILCAVVTCRSQEEKKSTHELENLKYFKARSRQLELIDFVIYFFNRKKRQQFSIAHRCQSNGNEIDLLSGRKKGEFRDFLSDSQSAFRCSASENTAPHSYSPRKHQKHCAKRINCRCESGTPLNRANELCPNACTCVSVCVPESCDKPQSATQESRNTKNGRRAMKHETLSLVCIEQNVRSILFYTRGLCHPKRGVVSSVRFVDGLIYPKGLVSQRKLARNPNKIKSHFGHIKYVCSRELALGLGNV